jgi:calcineurin-like phosphoesterase family protein
MKVFAISDTHLNHDKLIQYGRPEDFEDRILQNLRKAKGDILIHCGDFCIGDDDAMMKLFMAATAGFKKRILVRGNHDKKSDAWYMERGFDFVCSAFTNTYFGKNLVFTHAPIDPKLIRDSAFNIHGHMHGNTHRLEGDIARYYDPSYHIDLAPEIRNYGPVNIETLI